MFQGLPPRFPFPPGFPPSFQTPPGAGGGAGSLFGFPASFGVGAAVLERLTLVLNHVLSAEPEAMRRLAPHAGARLLIVWDGWPAWMPLPDRAAWAITPPGLLELDTAGAPTDAAAAAGSPNDAGWAADGADGSPTSGTAQTASDSGAATAAPADSAADLTVTLDARAVLQWVLQAPTRAEPSRPPMSIQGDAELATAVAWLAEHLRWDIEDDLARLIGDAPAHLLGRIGRGFAEALQRMLAPLRR